MRKLQHKYKGMKKKKKNKQTWIEISRIREQLTGI